MSVEKARDIETKILLWVADTAPADWRRFEINMELMTDGEEIANSWLIRCFTGDDETKIDRYKVAGTKKLEMRDLFIDLHSNSAHFGDQWTVCTLVVFNSGKYQIDYQYHAPPRLSGDLSATGFE